MAWIRWIPEDETSGRLAKLYRRVGGRHGVDHILKIHSLNAESLESDYQTAALSERERERAMLDYAVKLTRSPDAVGASDVDALRLVGMTDGEILDVCQITAYYNYVNRLADGLGVELEPYWQRQ